MTRALSFGLAIERTLKQIANSLSPLMGKSPFL